MTVPVYQIDFSAVAAGKRIATTKRRIRWRFGFANGEALDAGATGTACRGEEHEVNIVWSITSGKRQITMDGQEVHFSVNRSSVLDFSWSMRGSHVVKVVAHATAPLNNTPGFRQYNLFVDGQPFFQMPKVYELGLRGQVPSHARIPGTLDEGRYLEDSQIGREEEDLKRAIAMSLAESRDHLARKSNGYDNSQQYYGGDSGVSDPAPPPEPKPDLLDMAAQVAPAAAPPAPLAVTSQNLQPPSVPHGAGSPDVASSSYGVSPSVSTIGQYGAPSVAADALTVATAPPPAGPYSPYANVSDVASFTSAPPPTQVPDPFSQPVPPADDPFAPKPPPPPTHNDIANTILGAYGTAPAPVTPLGQQGPTDYQTPQLQLQNGPATVEQYAAPAVQLSMNSPLEDEKKEEPKTDVDAALKKLVNFEDISEPAEQELTLSMKPKEEKKSNKSKGLPPPAVMPNATLEQIKTVKPTSPSKDPESIMKPPPQLFSPGVVHAGALVVHGQGPPPLQRGFGVGAQMSGAGFGAGAQMNGYGYGVPPQQYQHPGGYAPPPPQQYQHPGGYAPPPQQQGYNNY